MRFLFPVLFLASASVADAQIYSQTTSYPGGYRPVGYVTGPLGVFNYGTIYDYQPPVSVTRTYEVPQPVVVERVETVRTEAVYPPGWMERQSVFRYGRLADGTYQATVIREGDPNRGKIYRWDDANQSWFLWGNTEQQPPRTVIQGETKQYPSGRTKSKFRIYQD